MTSKVSITGYFFVCTILFYPTTSKSEEKPSQTGSQQQPAVAAKPASTKQGLKRFHVGQPAPLIEGFASDGNVSNLKTNQGSFTLLAYWSLKDKHYEQDLRRVERIFKKHGTRPDFKIISFWREDWPEYQAEMNRRGSAFYGSRDWWKLKFIDSDHSQQGANEPDRLWGNDIKAGKTPVYILLDKEHKFLAIEIPGDQLEKTVEQHLNLIAD
ncbi:hypothetical protein [Gimesia algae]|uniref:Thioredoxin domain-containing protein n=1 Tax=Gimesia algae TaxID=2527971 RepID=A0A517VE90_9PLAN|nr:hypothetical protein [Gimesia algae]QDT91310.1 hypothetical protein Pan161_29670 [Gimesia algae]